MLVKKLVDARLLVTVRLDTVVEPKVEEPDTDRLVEEMFEEFRLVVVALVIVAEPVSSEVENRLLKVGELLKANVTLPRVSVATVRFAEEVKNLYKLEIEVVAITPFIVVVIIELFSLNEELFELMIVVEVASPFTMEVSVFTAEFN